MATCQTSLVVVGICNTSMPLLEFTSDIFNCNTSDTRALNSELYTYYNGCHECYITLLIYHISWEDAWAALWQDIQYCTNLGEMLADWLIRYTWHPKAYDSHMSANFNVCFRALLGRG